MRRILCVGLMILAGCQMTNGRIIPSPLSYSEQEKELLAIAPVGTEREEAVRKLSDAGIQGDFGTSRSIYYCDLWNRKNGERWHMNVALLFDKSGKLYKSQTAQSETAMLPTEQTKSGAAAPTNSKEPSRVVFTPGSTAASKTSPGNSSTGNLKVGRELLDNNRR
jgi:hypothetical protein